MGRVMIGEQTRIEPRRKVVPGDAEAIVELHERLYVAEYGMGQAFVDGVRDSVAAAIERGWPAGGGAWLVDSDDGLAGCLGLTDESDGLGKLRWVLLHPDLRGSGLGRRMIAGAVAEGRHLGFERLELDTFGALRSAAAIYRSQGFRCVSEERTEKWGPPIVFQHYVLELASDKAA